MNDLQLMITGLESNMEIHRKRIAEIESEPESGCRDGLNVLRIRIQLLSEVMAYAVDLMNDETQYHGDTK